MSFSAASPASAFAANNPRANPGQKIGATFFHDPAVAASVVTTIIAPGANTNGVILRTLAFGATTGSSTVRIYADTSAPSGISDATRRLVGFGATDQGSYQGIGPGTVLPAGLGLYFISNAVCIVGVSWDVL